MSGIWGSGRMQEGAVSKKDGILNRTGRTYQARNAGRSAGSDAYTTVSPLAQDPLCASLCTDSSHTSCMRHSSPHLSRLGPPRPCSPHAPKQFSCEHHHTVTLAAHMPPFPTPLTLEPSPLVVPRTSFSLMNTASRSNMSTWLSVTSPCTSSSTPASAMALSTGSTFFRSVTPASEFVVAPDRGKQRLAFRRGARLGADYTAPPPTPCWGPQGMDVALLRASRGVDVVGECAQLPGRHQPCCLLQLSCCTAPSLP